MNIKTTLIAATAAALAFAGGAFASDDMDFADVDGDNDGMISQTEVPSDHKLAGKFAQIDTNRNGSLSEAEFDAWKARSREDTGNDD